MPLVHDFGGFAQRYHQVQYRAPGAPDLAASVEALMPDHRTVARTDRGLDHGAYVPLTVMYPEADIPVLQMSLPTLEPDELLEHFAPIVPHLGRLRGSRADAGAADRRLPDGSGQAVLPGRIGSFPFGGFLHPAVSLPMSRPGRLDG